METRDPFLALHNLGRLQRQAGVVPEVAELVQAYGRLVLNAGGPLSFDPPEFEAGTPERHSFNHLARLNPNQDRRFLRFLASYAGLFRRRDLPVLFTLDSLCRALQVTPGKLRWIAANPGANYRALEIPKSDGRMRRILAPSGTLLDIQRWILHRMLGRCPPHECAHAFVRGRSIATNARLHVNKQVVVRLDLEDFFPSIRLKAVRAVFATLGYPYSVAHALARVCTVDGRLPQGAPTSPAISNLACVRLDRRLSGLAEQRGFDYTRYADDLIFSSDTAQLPRLIPLFRQIVQEEGYRLNEPKVRVMRASNRQVVTGVVTNCRPTLAREHVRKLRAAMHRLRTQGADAVTWPSSGGPGGAMAVVQGHLAFLQMVDPARRRAFDQG